MANAKKIAAKKTSTKKAVATRKATGAGKSMSAKAKKGTPSIAPSQATVRFYCQGIGDAHLLRFEKDDGSDFWMLIDCGIHTSIKGGRQKIDAIVADIAGRLPTDGKGGKRRLDLIVGTHEHWDHLSGFLTAHEKFRQFDVGEVWLGWTEDPCDPQARAFDTFKAKALTALQGTQQCLAGADGEHLGNVHRGVEQLLGFQFGLKGETTRAARDALVKLGERVRHVEPSTKPITLPGLPNLRIYVLGPPRDEKLIGVRTRQSEMYGLSAATRCADALINALAADDPGTHDLACPFDPGIGAPLDRMVQRAGDMTDPEEHRIAQLLEKTYLDKDAAKRRIDNDWLGVSAELAIQLDDRTNNSSVVLAFEFVDTGRVMLFAADAQVGNWLSWQDLSWRVGDTTVTGPELLARTVLYKVGHHGSENATLRDKGLERMVDKDLSAFIPTNKQDAADVKWKAMPFDPILDALHRRAGDRVIRADDPWIRKGPKPFTAPSGSIRRMATDTEDGLWVELDIA